MPRIYHVTFEDVVVSAVQDLFQVKGAAGKIVKVLRAHIGCTDTTTPTNQQVKIRARFLPATVTDGTGGSAPTPAKNDPGDAAASFSALANNTNKATTSGTAITEGQWGANIYAGMDEAFENPTPIGPSESWVLELLSTVGGTVHLSGHLVCSEEGG